MQGNIQDSIQNNREESNMASVIGRILTGPAFSHEALRERFFSMALEVPRLSGRNDILPVMASERLAYFGECRIGCMVRVRGQGAAQIPQPLERGEEPRGVIGLCAGDRYHRG